MGINTKDEFQSIQVNMSIIKARAYIDQLILRATTLKINYLPVILLGLASNCWFSGLAGNLLLPPVMLVFDIIVNQLYFYEC